MLTTLSFIALLVFIFLICIPKPIPALPHFNLATLTHTQHHIELLKRQNDFQALGPVAPFDPLVESALQWEKIQPEVGKFRNALKKFLDDAKDFFGLVEGWLGDGEDGNDGRGAASVKFSTVALETGFPGTTPRLHYTGAPKALPTEWWKNGRDGKNDKDAPRTTGLPTVSWLPGQVVKQTLDLGGSIH